TLVGGNVTIAAGIDLTMKALTGIQTGGSDYGGSIAISAANGNVSLYGSTSNNTLSTASGIQSGNVSIRSGGDLTLGGLINASSQGTGGSVNFAIRDGNL